MNDILGNELKVGQWVAVAFNFGNEIARITQVTDSDVQIQRYNKFWAATAKRRVYTGQLLILSQNFAEKIPDFS